MTAEGDVAPLVEKARVVAVVDHVGVLRSAVGCHGMALARLADVAVENHLAVDRHRDVVAHGLQYCNYNLYVNL